MILNNELHLQVMDICVFACVRACARQGYPRACVCFVSRETQFNIANVGAPLSQKTTSEMDTGLYMVYRPPLHYILPISQIRCSTPIYVCFTWNACSTLLCSTWNKTHVVDYQCVSLWNACGTLLLGRAVSDWSGWFNLWCSVTSWVALLSSWLHLLTILM